MHGFGLPNFGINDSAAIDLRVFAEDDHASSTIIPPKTHVKLGTGIAVHITSRNIVGLIYPRSSTGSKSHIILSNLVGVIDFGYTGEIMLPIHNDSDDEFFVNDGDRLFQMIFHHISKPTFQLVDDFEEESIRGDGGFGSTDNIYNIDGDGIDVEVPVNLLSDVASIVRGDDHHIKA